MFIRTALIAFLAFAPLSACGYLDTLGTLGHARVTTQQVVVIGNTFNALEATATNYLRLPRCTGSNGPVCAQSAVVAQIIPAVRSGRAARDGLEDFATAHPGELGGAGLYDALESSVATLQTIFKQYGVGK